MDIINGHSGLNNKPNHYFKQYRHLLNNLVKQSTIGTDYPIINLVISHDSSRAISVLKKNERTYLVCMYLLETYEQVFEEVVGGGPEQYIKMKEIEQNHNG